MTKHEITFQKHTLSDREASARFIEQDDIVLNDKTISSQTVENMIGMRFHQCLKLASD